MQAGAFERCKKNEACLNKWLMLELKGIKLADYFLERGIMQFCLYGYGTLGKLVVQAMQNSPVKILCVADKKGVELNNNFKEMHFCKEIPDDLKNEFVLFSVIWDRCRIEEELKTAGCEHILSLEHIIDILSQESGRKFGEPRYPELKKYADISNMSNLQVANFGTGMGYYDFCYDDFLGSAFNFSLPQQNLEFDYKLLTYYQEKFIPNCRICLVLSYCIFLAGQVLEGNEGNERYYSILPKEYVALRCNTSYEGYKTNRQSMCKIPQSAKISLELSEVPEKKVQEKQTQEIMRIWKEQLGIISYDKPVMTERQFKEIEETKNWLKKILIFCEERRLQPIIIIPPMSQDLLKQISQEFRKIYFYDIIQEVVDKKILILDYSNHEIFCNASFYGHPCFLVKEKARLFTKDVLRRIGVIES